MDKQLRSRAIQTVYYMLELTKGQIDPNDVLALGLFFGEVDSKKHPLQEIAEKLQQGLMYSLFRENTEYHLKQIEDGYIVTEDVTETPFPELTSAVIFLLERAGWFEER